MWLPMTYFRLCYLLYAWQHTLFKEQYAMLPIFMYTSEGGGKYPTTFKYVLVYIYTVDWYIYIYSRLICTSICIFKILYRKIVWWLHEFEARDLIWLVATNQTTNQKVLLLLWTLLYHTIGWLSSGMTYSATSSSPQTWHTPVR